MSEGYRFFLLVSWPMFTKTEVYLFLPHADQPGEPSDQEITGNYEGRDT